MTQPLQIGDKVHLGDFLAQISAFGVISDLDTPDQTEFSIEGFGSNAVLSMAALQGVPGPAGDNAPLGKLQFPVLESEDDLPTNLIDDPVDIGKYWIIRVFDGDGNEIGSNWAMWNGTAFEVFKEGMPGQAGPVPKVTPVFHVVQDTDTDTWDSSDQTNGYRIIKTGDDYNPTWTLEVNREIIRGPAGSGSNWNLYGAGAGVTGAEAEGDIPQWDGTKYAPAPLVVPQPKFWTYPEAAFTGVSLAIGTRVPIGTALIPPIDWDVVPYVQGHFRLTGVEADSTPFIIGIEVRLGNATSGQVVARGWGNISGYVNLQPHASTATTGSDAITPDNGRAVIPAGSTGTAATLYVNAFNDGLAGLYNFDPTGAQLSVLAVPV